MTDYTTATANVKDPYLIRMCLLRAIVRRAIVVVVVVVVPHRVLFLLCGLHPVKTSTWVTRCSGSAHRSGGSPEAFIVLQVYC